MAMIVLSVCLRGRFMRNLSNRTSAALARRGIRRREERQQQYAHTKAIAIQAFAYVVASIVTQIVSVVRSKNTDHTLQLIYTALRPCQGLLNFMVFFSQKVHNARRIDSSLSRRKAAIQVLTTKEKQHVQLSGISIVELNTIIRLGRFDVNDDDEEKDAEVRPEGINISADSPLTNTGTMPFSCSPPQVSLSTKTISNEKNESNVGNKTSVPQLDVNDDAKKNVKKHFSTFESKLSNGK